MKKRTSKRLTHHQNELKKRALKEENEKKRADYWRLYFDAKDIEHDIRELVMEAEIRRLVEIMIAYGIADTYIEVEDATPPDDEPKKSDSEPSDHEDDIPPRQKGLWD